MARIWFGLSLYFTEEENKETTFLVSVCVKVPSVHQLGRLEEIQPTSLNRQLDPPSSNSRRASQDMIPHTHPLSLCMRRWLHLRCRKSRDSVSLKQQATVPV